MDLVLLEKMRRFCAYQERCHDDVRHKLLSLKVYGDELETIMAKLVEDDFLNEERYARAYAGGKFRMLLWGKNKIKAALQQKHISDYCIRKGLMEIGDAEYLAAFTKLKKKAEQQYAGGHSAVRQQKIRQFLLRKGFEPAYISRHLLD